MKLVTLVPLAALGLAACGGGNKAAEDTSANVQNAAAPAPVVENASATANEQAPAVRGALSPAEVQAMVGRDGAAATVRALSQGGTPAAPNRFATIEDGIARGDQAWLDVVPLIRSGADGETGTGITMSLGEALPKNPAGVLRLIANKNDAQSICDDSLSDRTADQRREQREAAIAAVSAVNDPALGEAKANCLATLRAPAR
jgi:hypothetical protein